MPSVQYSSSSVEEIDVARYDVRVRVDRTVRATMPDCAASADIVSTMRPSRLIVLNVSGRGNLVFYTSF